MIYKLAFIACAFPAVAFAQLDVQLIVGKVVEVEDGDTFVIEIESEGEKVLETVRLELIDAPELKQAYGRKARAALKKKLLRKHVDVECQRRDIHDRILGQVYLGHAWINRELVAEGHAWAFTIQKPSKELAAAQVAAQRERVGLWANQSSMPPWRYRFANNMEGGIPPPLKPTPKVELIPEF